MVSGPLTILHAMRLTHFKAKSSLLVHLIGAEVHYEGSHLQAWECFFLHFLPDLQALKIIMIGPELNANSVKHEKIRYGTVCPSPFSLSYPY